ncbi:MAG: hypothetical protein AVDCRST_MAG78-704 [uncultured Rubrobacteraceae bacterium]|uniref:Uncharacterized protein n=1 Tax=uncultured Rubrobacteraceae bacterium TaxID=349277 RepID=A0A6J4PJS1_9ACTN|nr:MAG: hypothetical protein AVDCRST_MAG78-704 [uncultured Rubrobacteraceae bacterium]
MPAWIIPSGVDLLTTEKLAAIVRAYRGIVLTRTLRRMIHATVCVPVLTYFCTITPIRSLNRARDDAEKARSSDLVSCNASLFGVIYRVQAGELREVFRS